MSDTDSSEGVADGTARIIDNMVPGAHPSSREHDGRDAGDIESARAGVDLLFASIGSGLCPDGSILADDRPSLLWNAVEQLRSLVGRLDARLERRLREPTPEQREQREQDNEADGGETDYLLAHGIENTRRQLDILKQTFDHALNRYGEALGRPWLARHGTVDAHSSEYGLGTQIDSSAFFAAQELWQPAPDSLNRVREAMEHADLKRAALRAAAERRDPPARLEDLEFPFSAGDREATASAVAGIFQALTLIYPDGTQLQDERHAGAWRTVRMFDAGASSAAENALQRMTNHPALGPDPNPDAARRFDEKTRDSMLRIQELSRAADAAGALYCETTGEEEWKRRDPSMTAAGGPRDRTSLTGLHYAAAQRAAALGHPAPHQLDGPNIVIVGSPDLDMEENREAVETRLSQLHRRHPQMVLHYGARLRDAGGLDRNRGIDAIVHRWATGRRVPLVPNPPVWDAANNRYDLHSRDDAWIAMNPDLVVDFGGAGNAHRRFLDLAREKGIEFPGGDAGPRSYDAGEACAFRSARGPWGILSSVARLPEPISAAGHEFATSEHLFQAARFPESPEVQARIAGAPSARKAAELGREEGDETDAGWNRRRVDAMRWAIRMKREAHPGLVDAALDKTGNRPIVDLSNSDSFWGAREDGGTIVGQNTLGRLWMELRDQIRAGDPKARASAWTNPPIPDPLSADVVVRTPEPTAALDHVGVSLADDSGVRSYDADEACVFRTTRGEWGIFSNFANLPAPISAADRNFTTSEHLYQASKFRQSPEVQARIAGAASASEAAKIGRDGRNGPDADWNERRVNAMRWAIRMKRETHPALVDPAIEKTGNRPIVEFSNKDSFWGARRDGDKLVGQNILGRLWMELRQQIRTGDPKARASAWGDHLTPDPLSASVAHAAETNVAEDRDERSHAGAEARVFRWAGIGARNTPDPVLADMTALARQMAGAGFYLASGGAEGADAAFAAGTPVEQRAVWLPWKEFNKLTGPDCHTLSPERERECMAIAERLHPAWDKCRPGVRKMHARNVAILLGPNLDAPVDAVVCWTEGGRLRGGTGMGLLIARQWKIPVINLANTSLRSAWERLQQLQQEPPAARTASAPEAATVSRTREPDAEQWRAFRRERALTRLRPILRGLDIRTLPRAALAGLHRDTARTVAEESLDDLPRDRLLDALDSIKEQARQLRADRDAGGRSGPHAVETAKHVAALDAASDRIHAVLAAKTLEALREQEGLDTDIAKDAQQRVLKVMLAVWRLASEGPLATEPNRLVRAAAGAFLAEAGEIGRHLADETRIRSGLALAHAPGSEEETLALASRGPGQDPKKSGEAFEYMLTDVELKEKDAQYHALAMRSRLLDVMAETAQTFVQASHVDMRRRGADREERRTRHLQGVTSAPEVQRRWEELRDAHRQLIDSIYTDLVALCPADHVSAADPHHHASSDRDRLLARFASLFQYVERKIDDELMHSSRPGGNARNVDRLREARDYLIHLAGYAEHKVRELTDRPPLLRAPRTTQTAGEWLMERERRALHRQKAEALAPDGRHVAIVGGRRLDARHAGRIAELLNRERAANPGRPLVLHCIAQEGAGRYAAEWAASHGVTCVIHRPQHYSPAHLRRRDDLLLGIPPDAVWNFGADGDHERAASMLLDRAMEQSEAVEVRDMVSELEGPLTGDIAVGTREEAERKYARLHHAWQKADALAGDGVLIYQEGVEQLLPDIDHALANPHLAGHERRFLDAFRSLLESETRVRNDISRAIDRARDHLAAYEAFLEQRGPHQSGDALNRADPDYRRWDVRAEMIVQTFDNWSATENPAHREHLDRRRLDLADLVAEIRTIRKAARDPRAELHRVEISLVTGVHSWDQQFDRRRFTELALNTLRPEDERNPETVVELARWARAWPKESRAAFRALGETAAETEQKLHTQRLSAGLPPCLAAGMLHISEEAWSYQGHEIARQQAVRNRGMGLSA